MAFPCFVVAVDDFPLTSCIDLVLTKRNAFFLLIYGEVLWRHSSVVMLLIFIQIHFSVALANKMRAENTLLMLLNC